MIIGGRIAERIQVLGITQSELARRIGISQQAVGKLVHGGSRRTTYIAQIASELRTTPAYLTGKTDDPETDSPSAPALPSDARELVDHFETLSNADRRALLQIARSMAGGNAPSETVHQPGRGYRGEDK